MASSDIKKTSNILITRSEESSSSLVNHLEKLGFNCFCEPLFAVKKLHVIKQNWSDFSAVIITSSNAIDALVESGLPKNFKIFCVGKITAQRLTSLNFSNIEIAPEQSARSLLQLVKSKKISEQIAYFHGSKITLDFAKELPNITEIAAYETQEIKNFSSDFLQLGKKNSFDYVLIFSANSAEIFLKNLTKNNLLAYFAHSNLSCLSSSIGQKLEKNFTKITTFKDLPFLTKFYD